MSALSVSRQPVAQALPDLSSASMRMARALLVATWAGVSLLHLVAGVALRGRIWPYGYLLMELLASASLGWRAWRTRGAGRRAWGLLALSAALEIPNLLIRARSLQGSVAPALGQVPDLLSLVTGILVLVGVMSFPRGRESSGRRRRRVLDGLLFATAILFLLWVMGLQASLQAADRGIGLRVLVDYLNVALLGGGILFMISGQPSRFLGPLGWLGASGLAWLAGLSWFTLTAFHGPQASGLWEAVVCGIPLFQGLAAWSPRDVDGSEAPEDAESRLAKMVPYVPAILAVAVLATLLPRAPLHLMRGAIGLFLVLVVLLLLRQFQAIQDLQVARRTLEDRVRERTRALEQAQGTLLRTERLNTLALMGAGLAHDLNNLLSAMKGSAEIALEGLLEGDPPSQEDLGRIASAAERASALTRKLMGFVRQEVEEAAPLDLRLEMAGLEATLRMLVPRAVDLRVTVPPGEALLVRSSRARLEQMLVNLVSNAVDAMPSGGELAIRLGIGPADRAFVGIEVADSGSGMPPEVMARIFDPFFTTKPPGKGTGLGLPSLKALVEDAEGRVEVESRPGVGTRFRILLPRVDGVPEYELSSH